MIADDRNYTDTQYTITDIVDEPLRVFLKRKNIVIINPFSQMTAFIGLVFHKHFAETEEKGVETEKSLMAKIKDFDLFGRVDKIQDERIVDHKVVSTNMIFLLKKGKVELRPEWIKQLQYYYYLAKVNDLKIKDLELNIWGLRDVDASTPADFIFHRIYVPIPSDVKHLEAEIYDKMLVLYNYLKNNVVPPICENWNTERCNRYCNLNYLCPFFSDLKDNKGLEERVVEIPEETELHQKVSEYIMSQEVFKQYKKDVEEGRKRMLDYALKNRANVVKIKMEGEEKKFQVIRRERMTIDSQKLKELPDEIYQELLKRNIIRKIYYYTILPKNEETISSLD
jgi:hypothetical protein